LEERKTTLGKVDKPVNEQGIDYKSLINNLENLKF
jgi:hypothetical protein